MKMAAWFKHYQNGRNELNIRFTGIKEATKSKYTDRDFDITINVNDYNNGRPDRSDTYDQEFMKLLGDIFEGIKLKLGTEHHLKYYGNRKYRFFDFLSIIASSNGIPDYKFINW